MKAEWFKILYHFPWKSYRRYAAEYYDALYEFNIQEGKKRGEGICEQGDKKPECFFCIIEEFSGDNAHGVSVRAGAGVLVTHGYPNFVRVCGFAPKGKRDEYGMEHVPSLRKLEQFDQIMRESGLWNKIQVEEVGQNIKTGVIKKEEELVGDTTHYHAYSGFEVVRYADEKAEGARALKYGIPK